MILKIVMKFGGSLLASKGGVAKVADIVLKHSGHNVVVVVSAIGDVTDILFEAAKNAKGWNPAQIAHLVDRLRSIHMDAVNQVGLEEAKSREVVDALEELLENLKMTLIGISILGELTTRSTDLTLSFGERLSAPIVAAALEAKGKKSRSLTGGEAGIVTNDSYGEAIPIQARTRREVGRTLNPLLSDEIVPVVTGFLARTEGGEITTLGRGGSDFTATILADALNAGEVWIWTDVDGIMSADPRIVKEARVIEELSYAEAEEMAVFGAKNMHPLALGPARQGGISVRIKNGFEPGLPGTLITAREKKSASIVKSVALVKDVGMLTVLGETLAGRPGTAAMVFDALGKNGINILMISQSVSESNISMVVRKAVLGRAIDILSERLSESGIKASMKSDPGIAVIAAVGAGMRGSPGVAARVFTSVAEAGVNVKMIAQGSSELNISFAVKEADAMKSVKALHTALVLNR